MLLKYAKNVYCIKNSRDTIRKLKKKKKHGTKTRRTHNTDYQLVKNIRGTVYGGSTGHIL